MNPVVKVTRQLVLFLFFIVINAIWFTAIAQVKQNRQLQDDKNSKPIDTAAIEKIIGIKGKSNTASIKLPFHRTT